MNPEHPSQRNKRNLRGKQRHQPSHFSEGEEAKVIHLTEKQKIKLIQFMKEPFPTARV
jgi:hypothetical protein